jgi:cyclophilin family peptidyl-prolyl cis-trans isomerase/protein-disulfide isomerase
MIFSARQRFNKSHATWGISLWLALSLWLAGCAGENTPQKTAPPPPQVLLNTSEPTSDVGLTNPIDLNIMPRDYRLGPDEATVTVIMYGDFQCVRCARYAQNLEILRREFPNDLQIIWRHLPDTQSHDKADLALQAAEAAAQQGRFWDMHAMLFITQGEWQDLSPTAFREKLSDYAHAMGLNLSVFDAALNDGRFAGLAEQYRAQADTLQIVGIPTLLVNGVPLSDRDDLFGLRGAISLAILKARAYPAPPPFILQENVDYHAVLSTSKGLIEIDLLEESAPQTVNNFVFLAREGWYNGQTFFLVIPGFYAQTGDPSETGRGNAGYFIANENANGLVFDTPGMVAMSHPPGQPEQSSTQFFITSAVLPNHVQEWDGHYTIFGKVTVGLNVVQNLTARNPGDPLRFPNPPPGDAVFQITIEER